MTFPMSTACVQHGKNNVSKCIFKKHLRVKVIIFPRSITTIATIEKWIITTSICLFSSNKNNQRQYLKLFQEKVFKCVHMKQKQRIFVHTGPKITHAHIHILNTLSFCFCKYNNCYMLKFRRHTKLKVYYSLQSIWVDFHSDETRIKRGKENEWQREGERE